MLTLIVCMHFCSINFVVTIDYRIFYNKNFHNYSNTVYILSVISIYLRFPVPNLKNMKQPPWYQSSLRNEVLFASVSDVGLSSLLSPPALAGEATYCIDAYFNNAKGNTTSV